MVQQRGNTIFYKKSASFIYFYKIFPSCYETLRKDRCNYNCIAYYNTPPISAQRKGQRYVDSLLKDLSKQKKDTNKVNLLTAISSEYSSIDPAEGIRYGQLGLKLAEELGFKNGIAWANNSLGLNSYFRSDYPAALAYHMKALKIKEELGDKEGVVVVMMNIGNVHWQLHDYKKTLNYYLKALAISREIKDTQREAQLLGNIGLVYMRQGDYAKALEYDTVALKVVTKLRKKYLTANIYENISTVYQMQGDYPQALKNHFKALDVATEIEDKNLIAVCHGNIGTCYLDMAQDTGSTAFGDKAILSKSIQYLTTAVALCKEIGFLGPLQEFLSTLSEAQALTGNFKASLESYQQFVTIKDSIFSAENNITISNLETRRELELKDKQIEIDKLAVAKKKNERVFFIAGIALMLVIIAIIFRNYKLVVAQKKKVEQHTEELDHANNELNGTLINLRETQQQLIQSEKQKENEIIRRRISQDIHDDISSELTRISWVSELVKTKVMKNEFGDMPGLMEKITTSSRDTVAKLGEIIWAVSPQNDTLESLFNYMRSFTDRFFADTAFICKVNLPEQGADIPINPELKRNLFLVMKEALNNTVKYSEAKHIQVSMCIDGDAYRLTIADDGKGIEEGVIRGNGNGLNNMRRRMEHVKGHFNITSAPGKGTEICCSGILY